MWFNEFEKEKYGPFSTYVNSNADNLFLFEMNDGSILIVKDFSGDFESDNGLDIKDPGYEEYWERSFEIVDVVKDELNKYYEGGKICINYHCVPVSYKIMK